MTSALAPPSPSHPRRWGTVVVTNDWYIIINHILQGLYCTSSSLLPDDGQDSSIE